jgi:hypothetical protein
MAIKGKKKSQARGSQARRRPASAPRPVPSTRRRVPWYRTERGRLLVAAIGAVVVGFAWWGVARARSDAADRARRRDAVETYTGEARALLQGVRPAAQSMSQIPSSGGSDSDPGKIGRTANSWIKVLQSAHTEAGRIVPSPLVIDAHELFSQSVDVYLSAAKTYRLAARAGDSLAPEVLVRAGEQRDQASSIWLLATRLLDEERQSADLPPSGLGLPSSGAPTGQPSAPVSQPPSGSGGSSGKESKRKKGGSHGGGGGG